jgi:hypothetical protein
MLWLIKATRDDGNRSAAVDLYQLVGINLKPLQLAETHAASLAFLESSGDVLARLKESVTAFHDVAELIPQTESKLFSGHSFPYYESYKDLETSIHLAMQGFYKSAFISMRSCLELGLLCVYYDRNDDSEAVITDWIHSKDRTPVRKKIIEGLSKIDNVSTLNFRLPILESVSKLYEQLSNFVHTRGFPYSGEALNNSNSNAFNQASLKGLLDAATVTVQDLVILFLCKYPIGLFDLPLWDKFGLNAPLGGLLEPLQVYNLKKVVGKEVLSILEPVCKSDSTAKKMADYILSLPDLTEQQLDKQAVEVDKEGIKRSGFLSWKKRSAGAMRSSDPELDEYFGHRLAELEVWARENGLYERGERSAEDSEKADEP